MGLYLPSIKNKNNILIPYDPNSFYYYQCGYKNEFYVCPDCYNCQITSLVIDLTRASVDALKCYNCKYQYPIFVFAFIQQNIDTKLLKQWNYCFFHEVKTILI